MIGIYKFRIKEKPNMERESRVYDYFQTYMENLECIGLTKSKAALNTVIGEFVTSFNWFDNDDITGIAIMEEENLLDFIYETESGTLRWSTDHVDAMEYLDKELA